MSTGTEVRRLSVGEDTLSFVHDSGSLRPWVTTEYFLLNKEYWIFRGQTPSALTRDQVTNDYPFYRFCSDGLV